MEVVSLDYKKLMSCDFLCNRQYRFYSGIEIQNHTIKNRLNQCPCQQRIQHMWKAKRQRGITTTRRKPDCKTRTKKSNKITNRNDSIASWTRTSSTQGQPLKLSSVALGYLPHNMVTANIQNIQHYYISELQHITTWVSKRSKARATSTQEASKW